MSVQAPKTLPLATLVYLGIFASLIVLLGLIYFPISLIREQQNLILQVQSEQMMKELVGESQATLEKLAEQAIQQKAVDVAHQIEFYLQSHARASFDSDHFQKTFMQRFGESGYTAVFDRVTRITHVHPSPAIRGTKLDLFKTTLPEIWRIFERSLNGEGSKGFYNWKDESGAMRKKFMVTAPVGKSTLMVAATIYLDEFTQTSNLIQKTGDSILAQTQAEMKRRSTSVLRQTIFYSVLFELILVMLAGALGWALFKHWKDLRGFVSGLAQGNYRVELKLNSRIAEVKQLQSLLIHMRNQINLFQELKNTEIESNTALKLSRQIAHDIRTPLAALRAAMSPLSRSPDQILTLDQQSNLKHLLTAVSARLQDLVSSMLQIRTSYLGNITRFDLKKLAESIVSETAQRLELENRGIEITYAGDPDQTGPVEVIASRQNITRVFSNLIENSLESFENIPDLIKLEPNKIRVQIKRGQKDIVVSVWDNGPGISQDIIPYIFKNGFTSNKKEGSGIGLYFCTRVVDSHLGKLTVTSEPTSGTTFSFTLLTPDQFPNPFKEGKKILAIDDDSTLLKNIYDAATLRGIEGDYFSSYEQFQDYIKTDRSPLNYGTVVLDHRVANSQYNAVSMSRAIRKLIPELIPIVVCTSEPNEPSLAVLNSDPHLKIIGKSLYLEVFGVS